MQTAGSTGPSRTGYGTDGPAGPPSIKLEEDLAGPAALAAQAGPAAPEGVRQALLTGLKRDAEAARLSLKQEEMAEPEPVKRRRRRKGIRDPRLQLNEDVMARVLPYLAKTSVRHLLILSMVNKDLYEQVTEAHAIWRRLYLAWENRIYSRAAPSLGSEFAARCLQVWARVLACVQETPVTARGRRPCPTGWAPRRFPTRWST